jgi:molybdate transport system substrate-binding protein
MLARRALLSGVLAALRLALPREAAAGGPPPALTVFAASDLAFAFAELLRRFESLSGTRVTTVLGSTGNLAKQIEQGAPADVFFAANAAFVETLAERGAVLPDSRTRYARGSIVLATREADALPIARLADLLRPEVRRVALANPDHAPYGQAAREALEASGLWARVAPRLVYGENVRQALQLLQSGAVEAAIVARSVAGVAGIRALPIDEALHRPLDQVAAVTTRARDPQAARRLIAFVLSPEGQAALARFGFGRPTPTTWRRLHPLRPVAPAAARSTGGAEGP